MKKFLSIMLAILCVFSTATIAFASTNKCPYCEEIYTDEAEYNKHLADCDGFFRVCPYGCDADFATDEELAIHIGVCLEFVGECDYCGAEVRTLNAFNAHVEECKVKYCGIPVHKIMKFLQETDLYDIFHGNNPLFLLYKGRKRGYNAICKAMTGTGSFGSVHFSEPRLVQGGMGPR